MRDDIPVLLRDAAVDPSHTPDFEALAARGRRQHVAVRAGTALVAVLALIAGGLGVWPDGQPARRPVIADQPTTPDHVEETITLPTGWHEIPVGEAVFGVPGDWTVETFDEPANVCPNHAEQPTAFVMQAGPQGGENRCWAVAQRVLVVQAAPLSAIPPAYLEPDPGLAWDDITTSGGVDGQRLVRNDHGTTIAYRFAALDLWLQVAAPDPLTAQADDILATVTAATEGPDAASGSSCPEGPPDSVIEWVSFVQVGQRMMTQVGHADRIPRERLGERLFKTRCRIADRAGTDYRPRSGDAAFLGAGTPVYAIAGVDPGFRVVADDGGQLLMFEVRTAEDAETADDVFDIEDNVTAIDVTRRHVAEGTTGTGEITGADSIRHFVDELLSAELAPGRQPSTNEVTYRITLHLRDGPPLDLLLYPGDNLLSHPWIIFPPSLTELIERAANPRGDRS